MCKFYKEGLYLQIKNKQVEVENRGKQWKVAMKYFVV